MEIKLHEVGLDVRWINTQGHTMSHLLALPTDTRCAQCGKILRSGFDSDDTGWLDCKTNRVYCEACITKN